MKSVPKGLTTAPMSKYGFTMIELLIVIGMLGILATMAVSNLRAPAARVAADSVSSTIQHARFEAVKRNRPVVVRVEPGLGYLRLFEASDATTIDCEPGSGPLKTLDVSEFRGVSLTGDAQAFVWLPSGQLRGCNGAWLMNDLTLGLTDAKSNAAVRISTGGEVTVQ